jgi:MFS family permease
MSLVHVALALIRPVTTYRAIDLGAGATEVGLLTGAFALLPMAVALPLGRAADRWRPEPVLAAGVALLALGGLLLAVSDSLPDVAVGNVVLGLGNLGCVVGGENLVARLPANALDRGFGMFTAVVSGGQLVGPALAGALLATAPGQLASGTARALLLAAAILGLALPLALRLRTGRPTAKGQGTAAGSSTLQLLRRPRVPAVLFTSLVLAATVDLLIAYLPLLGESRGIAPATIGVLLSVRAAATVASRLLVDRLLALLGRGRLVAVSTVGSGLGIVVLPFVQDVGVLAALLFAVGLVLGAGQPLMMTALVLAVPEGARGTVLALRLVGHRLGLVTLPSAAGLVAGAAGTPAAFWLLGGLLTVATVGARGQGK